MVQLDPNSGFLNPRQKEGRTRLVKNLHLQLVLKTHGREAVEKFLQRDKNMLPIVCMYIFQELAQEPHNLYLIQKLYEFSFYATPAQRKQLGDGTSPLLKVMGERIDPFLQLVKYPDNPTVLLSLCKLFSEDSELVLWLLEIVFSEEYEKRQRDNFSVQISAGVYISLLENLLKKSEFRKKLEEVVISAAKSASNPHEFFDAVISLAQQYRELHTADTIIASVIQSFGAAKVQISLSGQKLDALEVRDSSAVQESAAGKKIQEHRTSEQEIEEIQKRIPNESREQKIASYSRLLYLLIKEGNHESFFKSSESALRERVFDEPAVKIQVLRGHKIFSKNNHCRPLSQEEKTELARLVYETEKSPASRLDYGIALCDADRYSEAIDELTFENCQDEREGERLFYLGLAYRAKSREFCSVGIECLETILQQNAKGVSHLLVLRCLAAAYLERKFPGDEARAKEALVQVLALDIFFRDALTFYEDNVLSSVNQPEQSDSYDSELFSWCLNYIDDGESEERIENFLRDRETKEFQERKARKTLTDSENYFSGILSVRSGDSRDAVECFQRAASSQARRIQERALICSVILIAREIKLSTLAQSILERHGEFQTISPKIILALFGEIIFLTGDAREAHQKYSRALCLTSENDTDLRKLLEERISLTWQIIHPES